MPRSTSRITRTAITTAALLALGGAGAAPTFASGSPAGTCAGQSFSQPFASFKDASAYTLAPGGDFEDGGQGWTFSGNAEVVTDGDAAHGDGAARINNGGSVTSPPVCVAADYPSARMFGASKNGKKSRLRVEMLYVHPKLGQPTSKDVGDVDTDTPAWAPTRSFKVDQGALQLRSNTALVQFRFTAERGAHLRIDDVYIDPRMRG
jgi:hypothetical protein